MCVCICVCKCVCVLMWVWVPNHTTQDISKQSLAPATTKRKGFVQENGCFTDFIGKMQNMKYKPLGGTGCQLLAKRPESTFNPA